MIVETSQLSGFRGQVAMVSGGFDPLHDGHVEYFRQAALLDAPVLCNVSSDDYLRHKHTPLLPQDRRAVVIDALRDIAYTHLASGTTAEVLEQLRPRYFVKGADWEGRLPGDEEAICREHGVEVLYLDSVRNSSSRIVESFAAGNDIRLGQLSER